MAIADLSNVLNIFRGKEPPTTDEPALMKEVMLMTLARATSADANIHPCEVTTVQEILKAHTGDDFSEADIRLASRPNLYEEAPFGNYLRKVRKKMTDKARVEVVVALAEVIKSDTEVRELEIDFFNMVATELKATPAEIIGLTKS